MEMMRKGEWRKEVVVKNKNSNLLVGDMGWEDMISGFGRIVEC